MKGRDISLAPAIGLFVALLVVVATGAVALSSYVTGTKLSERLLDGATRNLTEIISQRTLRFLDPAGPHARQTTALVAQGELDPSDDQQVLRYLHGALLANENFTWASLGGADGRYLAAFRRPDGSVHVTHRTPLAPQAPPDKANQCHYHQYRCHSRDRWELIEEYDKAYDPRVRPWYEGALENPDGAWVGPYLFFTDWQPGVTYVLQQRVEDRIVGVWGVDYELRDISEFLRKLEVFETGRAYVLDGKGRLVGHPDGEVRTPDAENPGRYRMIHVSEHPDAMLRTAWQAMAEQAPKALTNLTYGSYVGAAAPLDVEGGVDWFVLIAVPRSEVYGQTEAELARAGWIAAACLILGVLLGLLFARQVSRSVHKVTAELGAISRLNLSDRRLSDQPGLIREFNRIGEATDTMKTGIRSFARYVPRDLVQELLGGGLRAELGGKRMPLTVFFVDVADFTSIAERLSPEQLVHGMERYFRFVIETIKQHRGTVDKLLGDAVMAFWGAPRRVDDHAKGACAAALAIGDEFARAIDAGALEIRIRIGINTGDTVVGNIGSHDRMDYTVMGDTVNLAARLEGLGKVYGCQVLIGEETARAVSDAFVVRPLDWVAVKGRTQPVLVHELVGRVGEVDPEALERNRRYADALEAYGRGAFEEANAAFVAVEGDAAAAVMAKRCEALLAQPPTSWDGVWVMGYK